MFNNLFRNHIKVFFFNYSHCKCFHIHINISVFLYLNKGIRGQRESFFFPFLPKLQSVDHILPKIYNLRTMPHVNQYLANPMSIKAAGATRIYFVRSYWCEKSSTVWLILIRMLRYLSLMRSLNVFPIVPECGYLDWQRCINWCKAKPAPLWEAWPLSLPSILTPSYSSGIWNKQFCIKP